MKHEDIEYLTFVQPFAAIGEQDLALLDAGEVEDKLGWLLDGSQHMILFLFLCCM